MKPAGIIFFAVLGYLFIQIGLQGNLGSVIGAIIAPSDMVDSTGTSQSGSGSGSSSSGINSGPPGELSSGSTLTSNASGVLTATQIKGYAVAAGFSGSALTTAVAIALAESGGNTNAVNHESNGTLSTGLWQINSVHSQYSQSSLTQPLYNAKAAWSISSMGTNFTPWSTFTSNAYQRYLTQAANA